MTFLEDAVMAKSIYKSEILSLPNVVGVGVGYKVSGSRESDEISVVVMVQQKLPPVSLPDVDFIPPEVGGVRTDVVEVGILRPLQTRTERVRPVPGGMSIGHHRITAGTFGCVVRDRQSGARMILSNNHVLADRNSGSPGDPILQPGPADGGTQEHDTIALLERFERINFNEEPAACSLAQAYANAGNTLARWLGSQHRVEAIQFRPQAVNLIDAAIARPILDSEVLDEILEVGEVAGVKEAELGMAVVKSGRTTAFTTGVINILDATLTVGYGGDRNAVFEHQFVSTAMSEGGDSGSLLLESGSKMAVGLLFAGSSQATLFNPIQAVLNGLQVDFAATRAKSVGGRRAEIEKVQAVKEAHLDELMAKPNVVGVGIGRGGTAGMPAGELGLVVLVSQQVPEALLPSEELIPSEINGVPVYVKEVGDLTAY